MSETTTDTLAEIEGQAADYTPPEGWRVLQEGEVLEAGDEIVQLDDGKRHPTYLVGCSVGAGQRYIRRIEQPEPSITPDDVAAEALAGVNEWPSVQTLRRQLETTEAALLEQQQQNQKLLTHSSHQHMQIAELRSEVSQIHRQWGDSRWRVEELEQKLAESQPQPVHLQAMIDSQAETIARLHSDIHGLNMEIGGLQRQLEAVKDELVQVSKDRQALQIELDAREQVPQAVSDRFEEGWDKGTARAVETIAEWTEAFRTCGSQGLSYHVMQNLPHIMRTLTGLTDED